MRPPAVEIEASVSFFSLVDDVSGHIKERGETHLNQAPPVLTWYLVAIMTKDIMLFTGFLHLS